MSGFLFWALIGVIVGLAAIGLAFVILIVCLCLLAKDDAVLHELARGPK